MAIRRPLVLVTGRLKEMLTGDAVGIENGGTGSITATAARIALGLAIGTDVQGYSANLDLWAGKMPSQYAALGTANTWTAPQNFSSGLSGSLSGNASTATELQAARTLTIGGTGKSFNGSANVSWTLAEMGVLGNAGDQVLSLGTLRVQPVGDQVWIRAEGASGVTIDAVNSDNSAFAELVLRGSTVRVPTNLFAAAGVYIGGNTNSPFIYNSSGDLMLRPYDGTTAAYFQFGRDGSLIALNGGVRGGNLRAYGGPSSTKTPLVLLGHSNGVARWDFTLEANDALSLNSYNTSGGGGLTAMTFSSAVAGGPTTITLFANPTVQILGEAHINLNCTSAGGRNIRVVSNATPNAGIYDVTNSRWLLRIASDDVVEIRNVLRVYTANLATTVRTPRIFVGGTDPGLQAENGDIWIQ